MNILLVFVILFCSVIKSQKLNEGSNITSSSSENFRQKMSSELDEINSDTSYPIRQLISESKGGALQRLLSSVTFICKGRFEGYYADTEFGCQTFHYCKQNGLRFTFVCPSDSIFNQKEMTCDHNVSEPYKLCIESHNYYYLNAMLYAQKKEVLNDTDVTPVISQQNSSQILPLIQKIDKKESAVYLKNKSKQTGDPIIPFKGFVSLNHKNSDNYNKSEEKWLQMSSVISKNDKQKLQSYSTQNDNKWTKYLPNISSEQYSNKSFPTQMKAINGEKSSLKLKAANISSLNNSIESEINFHNNKSNHIDWDDIETGIKLEAFPGRPNHYFNIKPNFNEVVNPANLFNYANTAHIPLPALPVPLMKPGSLVLLRPNYIPGTLPIATLYKQTEYMFGKPHVVHKGLYLNPNFGAAIVSPQPLVSPQPFVSPIGLIPSPSDRFNPKVIHKNSKILSNFQNALTKFSFNDIFSLKGIPLSQISPKRKGSDKFSKSLLKIPKVPAMPAMPAMPTIPSFDQIYFNLENPFHRNRLVINDRLSSEETPTKPYFADNIPMNIEKLVLLSDKPPDIEEMNESLKPNEHIFHTKPKSLKYSLKMDEKIDLNSKHIITQPSIFTNITNDKTKKWVENYAKIKKKYIEREKKSQQNARKTQRRRKNLQTFDQKMYEKL